MAKRALIFSAYGIEIWREKRLLGTRLILKFDRGAHGESFVEYKITDAQAQSIEASEEAAWATINEVLGSHNKPTRRG